MTAEVKYFPDLGDTLALLKSLLWSAGLRCNLWARESLYSAITPEAITASLTLGSFRLHWSFLMVSTAAGGEK